LINFVSFKKLTQRQLYFFVHCTAARLLPSASTSTRLRLVSTTSTLFNEHNKSTNNFNIQDDDDFESRVIHSQTPVVVDFHAEYVFISECVSL